MRQLCCNLPYVMLQPSCKSSDPLDGHPELLFSVTRINGWSGSACPDAVVRRSKRRRGAPERFSYGEVPVLGSLHVRSRGGSSRSAEECQEWCHAPKAPDQPPRS